MIMNNGEHQLGSYAKKLGALDRLSTWAKEHGYETNFRYDRHNYFIGYNHNSKEWNYYFEYNVEHPSAIYMSKDGAEAAVEALNSGGLVL